MVWITAMARHSDNKAKGRSARAEICRMVLAAAIYYCWQERNWAVFQKKRRTPKAILRLIIQEIHVRATRFPKLARVMSTLDWYPEI
ncbi:hypothetical protein A4A49_54444 [Nicotiana attenuata]|uniref:Reverse transcriptase zinc-binding domain-containing protein n=1 Tax=Nicotiana attenuata TaxID=49451 RepID=A0A1J6KIM7_NICAT|nr:hypothetical protein A4A49_54444 [Nicotiana attenuata]